MSPSEAAGEESEVRLTGRRLGAALGVLLLALTAYVAWFDYAAVTAIFHPGSDASGNLLFQVPGFSNTVYPFTYAAVAASILGVGWFVFRAERAPLGRPAAVLLAVLIANLASIGMINLYEQWFVVGLYATPRLHTSGVYAIRLYWDNAGAVANTLGGLLIVLSILPWARGRNWPGVLTLVGLTAVAFLAWVWTGFWEPMNGNAFDYAMNALSRIALQLTLVAAVSREDWVRWLARHIVRATRQGSTTPAHGPSSVPPTTGSDRT